MKISILDQAPISSGKAARVALHESMKLAQMGEKLGYTRYWIAEHHDLPGLACPAPEVMLGYIGAQTEKIRLGSGAVLLPHYKPYKIAEIYNMLSTLFPDRIDIGIGRAPGGSAEATMALSDNFLEQVRKMPDLVDELLHFLYLDFPTDHMFSKISAAPVPSVPPEPWILGTSEKSAILAAKNGAAYTFGHFMSDKDGTAIMQSYLEHFNPKGRLKKPRSIVAVSVICAETAEKADEIALSEQVWKIQQAQGLSTNGVPAIEEAKQYLFNQADNKILNNMRDKRVIGTPKKVAKKLIHLKNNYQADEIMIVTITYSFEDRIRSYELIAKELL